MLTSLLHLPHPSTARHGTARHGTARHGTAMLCVLSGLLAGFAVTIKPTVAPVLLLPILLPALGTQPTLTRIRHAFVALAGELLPLLGVLLFLMHAHALASFWTLSTAMIRLHASLDHRPLFYLFTHSYAPLLPVLLFWLPISVRESWRGRRLILALFAIIGLLSYVLQHKGYPYHRYPFLAFVLLLVCIDLDAALRRAGMLRVCAIAALLVLAGFIVPLSAWRVRSFDWKNQEFMTDPQFDLNAAGGPALDGRVQCFDTTAGCINTLERMQMVQATGYLYDCYLLEPGNDPALLRLRDNFLAQITARPPLVLVVTNQYCLGNPRDFEKIRRWPALSQFVAQHYQLAEERVPVKPVRWWSHTQAPWAYRIYRLTLRPK